MLMCANRLPSPKRYQTVENGIKALSLILGNLLMSQGQNTPNFRWCLTVWSLL